MNILARTFGQVISAASKNVILLFVGALVACGGGSTGGGAGSLLGPAPSSQTPSEPDPSPGVSPGASPTPVVITPSPAPAAPVASPSVSPSPTPVVLSKPNVSVSITSRGLNVNWGQNNATAYRVLVFVEDGEPSEYMATGPSSVVPLNGFGSYTVIVEAYDHLGNSLFSDPRFVEVGQ